MSATINIPQFVKYFDIKISNNNIGYIKRQETS